MNTKIQTQDDYSAPSLHLYHYLCKLFGSPEVVKLRRTIYTAAEALCNYTNVRVIPSGSRCEGFEIEGSDFDIMDLDKRVRVYETFSDNYHENDTLSVIMDYSQTSLGFTRLKLLNIHNVSERARRSYHTIMKVCMNVGSGHYLSSLLVRNIHARKDSTPHGPCHLIVKKDNFEIESLTCYRCRQWFSLAKPWTTRIRKSWPNQQLINDVTQYGVLVVPVGSKTSQYSDIEWRISFSIAEKQLVHSFTHTQLLCYAMLKVVVSDIIKKQHGELLCSYFVKTIMFWLSEEHESNFWTPVNIVNCFMVCLQRLIYCVQNRDCRHYFIPEINFFEERFSETDHISLLSSLHQLYNIGFRALFHTDTFRGFKSLQLRCSDITSSVIAPIGFIWGLPEVGSFDLSQLLKNCLQQTISKATKRVLFYVTAAFCQLRITRVNSIFINHVDNKTVYKQYKRLLPEIVINTRTDCVSGWCYLASLFYKLKHYRTCIYIVDYCLRKLTHNNIYMTASPHISLPVHIQNTTCKSRWFLAVLRHCCTDIFRLESQSLSPEELSIFWSDDYKSIVITPLVYMSFLKFICLHHCKQEREKKIAFKELQRAVRDEVFIMNGDLMFSAGKVVELAGSLLHEVWTS